jgi:hypothetical protein
MPETETRHCANCGSAIGNLETPRVYKNHAVCADCYQKLNRRFGGALDMHNPVHVLIVVVIAAATVPPLLGALWYFIRALMAQ